MRRLCFLLLSVAGLGAQEPLTLREALQAVGRLNPSVQIARLDALEREAEVLRTKAAYGPQASFVLGGSRQTSNLQGIGLALPGFSNRIGPYQLFNARPTISQTVVDLSLLTEIRAARARHAATRFDVETARESSQFAVLQLYLQILEADSRIKAGEARVRTAEALRTQVQDRLDAGTASRLDLERVEGELADERVRLSAAGRDRDILKTMLVRTAGLGQPIGELEPVAMKDVAAVKDEVLAQALSDRPEVRSLDRQAAAASLAVTSARQQRMPRLNVQADWGLLGSGPQQSIGTYALGATLTIPIWTSGRIEAEQRIASLQGQKVAARQRDVQLEIRQQVEQSIVEMDRARHSLRESERSTNAAREVLELSSLRASTGLATSLDVVIAQGRLAEAEDQLIRSRYQLQLAQARLAHARGNVWSFLD